MNENSDILFSNIELRCIEKDNEKYIFFKFTDKFKFTLPIYKAAFIFTQNAVNMIQYQIKSLEIELDNLKIKLKLDESVVILNIENKESETVEIELSYGQLIKIIAYISSMMIK